MVQTAPETTDSREQLLVAALRCFGEKGFEGATARDIAARAGVNHGLIRYHFGDKEKLWRAAVERAFSRLEAGAALAREHTSATDDRARAGLLIRNTVRFVARYPEFARLMNDEGKRKGPRMRWIVDRHIKPLFEVICALAEHRGILRGLPPDIAPVHIFYILTGSIVLIYHQAEECKRLAGCDPFDEAMVEAHARAVEHMLLGPPSPLEPSQNEEPPA